MSNSRDPVHDAFDALRRDVLDLDSGAALRTARSTPRRWFAWFAAGAFVAALVAIGLVVVLHDDTGGVVARGDIEPADGEEPESSVVNASELVGTKWTLVSGSTPSGDLAPTEYSLDFTPGRVGGFATCVGYIAGFTSSGTDVEIDVWSTTSLTCDPGAGAYFDALALVERITVADEALSLAGPGVSLVFEPTPTAPVDEVVEQLWLLDEISFGTTTRRPEDVAATLSLSADGSIDATSGCSSRVGTYEVGGEWFSTSWSDVSGVCPPHLRVQDDAVFEVLIGFTAEVDGERLTLASIHDDRGLVYRAIESAEPDASEPPSGSLTPEDLADSVWELLSGEGPDGPLDPKLGSRPTLIFDSELAISGTMPVNRYWATADIGADGFRVTQLASEAQGSLDPAVNAQETTFNEALLAVDEIRIDGDMLVLTGLDSELVFGRFARPDSPTGAGLRQFFDDHYADAPVPYVGPCSTGESTAPTDLCTLEPVATDADDTYEVLIASADNYDTVTGGFRPTDFGIGVFTMRHRGDDQWELVDTGSIGIPDDVAD